MTITNIIHNLSLITYYELLLCGLPQLYYLYMKNSLLLYSWISLEISSGWSQGFLRSQNTLDLLIWTKGTTWTQGYPIWKILEISSSFDLLFFLTKENHLKSQVADLKDTWTKDPWILKVPWPIYLNRRKPLAFKGTWTESPPNLKVPWPTFFNLKRCFTKYIKRCLTKYAWSQVADLKDTWN